LIPGKTLLDRLRKLTDYGFEGVELLGSGLRENHREAEEALDKVDVPVAAICAGYRSVVLEADPDLRDQAISDCKTLLSIAGDLGAVGLIFVPIHGRPRIGDLRPLHTVVELEMMLLLKILQDLGEHAEKAKALILLEPLNRYETHLLKRLEQAVEVCQQVGNPNLHIMADFFHMSIEEADIPSSIRAAGSHISHVHLADSNRLLPGHGHTDFRAGFAALAEVGFDKYMSLECSVPGQADVELPKCVQYLKSCRPTSSGR
jgi:sugar phosphate isomerase/epimerase